MRALKIVLRTFSHVLSVVLCLVLMVATMATMFVANVRVAADANVLTDVIKEFLSAPPQYSSGLITGAVGDELDIGALLSGGDLTSTLVEMAMDMLEEQELPFDQEAIEAFVEESTLKDFIAEKASTIVSDIITGENTTTITGEEIQQLLTENKDLLEEHFEIILTEEEIEQVAQKVEELPVVQEIQQNGVAGLLGSTDNTSPDGEGGGTFDDAASSSPLAAIKEIQGYIQMLSSDAVFFACIGVCLLLLALLFLLAWNKPYIALIYSGVTVTFTGLLFFVPTIIATSQVSTWMSLFSNIPDYGQIIGHAIRMVLMLTSSVTYTFTGVGAALFVGGIVLFIVMKKAKKAKAAKAAAIEEAPAASPFAEAAAELYETTPVVEEAPAAEEAAPAEEPAAEEAAPAEEVAPVETV